MDRVVSNETRSSSISAGRTFHSRISRGRSARRVGTRSRVGGSDNPTYCVRALVLMWSGTLWGATLSSFLFQVWAALRLRHCMTAYTGGAPTPPAFRNPIRSPHDSWSSFGLAAGGEVGARTGRQLSRRTRHGGQDGPGRRRHSRRAFDQDLCVRNAAVMRPPNIGLEPSRLLSRAIMSPWRPAQAGR